LRVTLAQGTRCRENISKQEIAPRSKGKQ
jgi:hypothetical protein